MKLLKPFVVALALCAASVTMLHAAPDDAADVPATPGTAPAKPKKARKPRAPKGTAYVRVLHAIPAGPSVDVYVDANKVLTAVTYKTISDYLPVPSGSHNLKVTATGQTDALLEAKKTLGKDRFFTVIAYGTAQAPALLAQNESTGTDLPGKAKLRVYHLVAGGPDIDITSPSTRTKTGLKSVFKNLTFGKTMQKNIAPGTLTLQVRSADKLLKEVTGTPFEDGKRYAVFAIGTPDALELLVKPAAQK